MQPLRAAQARPHSELLNYYAARGDVHTVAQKRRRLAIPTPAVFSFIDDPDRALRALATFVREITGGARTITVNQVPSFQIDLCAASVLNALALEASRLKVGFRGYYPVDPLAREIVIATGLPKVLELPNEEPEGFLTFPLVRGGQQRSSAVAASEKEVETANLVRYIDRCLQQVNYSLSRLGMERLGKLVSEVLGNAEEHAGRPQWWIAGYLRRPQGGTIGDCHITIFNFGRTLAESLQMLPVGARLRAEIEALVHHHRRARLFQRRKWTEENLWTLYALQEGVTRFHGEVGDQHGHRGMGMADIIEMFQVLGQTDATPERAKMCLVSGRTHILFDGTYTMQPQAVADGEARRVIAFNEANDLFHPPNPRYVRRLQSYFPGTLISLRFFLDEEYLTRLYSRVRYGPPA